MTSISAVRLETRAATKPRYTLDNSMQRTSMAVKLAKMDKHMDTWMTDQWPDVKAQLVAVTATILFWLLISVAVVAVVVVVSRLTRHCLSSLRVIKQQRWTLSQPSLLSYKSTPSQQQQQSPDVVIVVLDESFSRRQQVSSAPFAADACAACTATAAPAYEERAVDVGPVIKQQMSFPPETSERTRSP